MDKIITQQCFLLTYNGRDRSGHFEIDLFAKNNEGMPVHITVTNFRPLFFISSYVPLQYTSMAIERKPLPLKSFNGTTVDCLYFATHTDLKACARKLRDCSQPIFESDVDPVERFLMERNVRGGFEAIGTIRINDGIIEMTNPRIRGGINVIPGLSVLSLDIENNAQKGEIYSIACSGVKDIVFIIGNGNGNENPPIVYCKDEKNLLMHFFRHLQKEDPDIIIGWNVIDFDLKVIANRCRSLGVPFNAARKGGYGSIFSSQAGNRTIIRIDGRVIIDVPVILRTYYPSFEKYSLNFIASKLLGKTKEITLYGRDKIAEIDRLFAQDKVSLASYNLQDAILTRKIFEKTDLLSNAVERSRLSGHLLDRTGGSIDAFDYLYLPRLHRAGYVAPDASASHTTDTNLPGGFVIEPKAGIYENVLVFDFRSLYPSIIMSFLIDPLGLIHPSDDRIVCPAGTSYARSPSILPGVIAELLQERNEAKRINNLHLAKAIKLIMNSFYGVLGAKNCRFFSTELASSITRTGHYILKKSIEFIEKTTGLPVIYGDTDSLFVLLGTGYKNDHEATGKEIAIKTTEWLAEHLKKQYNVESALLLQFETAFRHFLIPAVRGGESGSKKHYCGGNYIDGNLVLSFKGMESARSDWTDCAKEFQQELVRRIFTGKKVEDYILETISNVEAGKLDEKLVYRKRIRKQLDAYTKNIPPHVQAARMLNSTPSTVRYYITVDGPQPLEKLRSPIDYRHYIDCQLQPVADSILELIGKKFSYIVSGQQELFGR